MVDLIVERKRQREIIRRFIAWSASGSAAEPAAAGRASG
jgi:hypothetical protein